LTKVTARITDRVRKRISASQSIRHFGAGKGIISPQGNASHSVLNWLEGELPPLSHADLLKLLASTALDIFINFHLCPFY